MKISSQEIELFKHKIEKDKLEYFKACNNHYKLYVDIAQYLFPDIYKKMEEIDRNLNPYENFVVKANNLKIKELLDKEIEVLEGGIKNEIYIPGGYERLAIIYSKKREFKDALSVCQKCFSTDYWKLPNMASTSKRLLLRKQKLETKLLQNGK